MTKPYTPPPPPSALDPGSQPEYALRLREALHQALITAGTDKPGDPTVIRVATAARELARIMTFAVHNAPSMRVPSRRRKWCEDFARTLRLEIELAQHAAAAGAMPDFLHVDDRAIEWPR